MPYLKVICFRPYRGGTGEGEAAMLERGFERLKQSCGEKVERFGFCPIG